MTTQPPTTMLSSCAVVQHRKADRFLAEHLLVCILRGEVQFHTAQGTYRYGPGQLVLVRKNQLVHDVQLPSMDGEPAEVISVWLRQEALRRYAAHYILAPAGAYHGSVIVELSADPLLTGYFASLQPYLGRASQLDGPLAELKTAEVVALLLRTQPALHGFLFDFQAPDKIGLEAFMRQHYAFNVPLSKFAWLTGRSLATFKRDFQKTFGQAPQQWLRQQRLRQAHFLLAERRHKPSAVYLEVGFENFSHFCRAFRQQFGYSPVQAREPLGTVDLSR